MASKELPFQIIHRHAAGIDVGSHSHLVAVDQHKDNVREFEDYTKDHKAFIGRLQNYGITAIAMESTGSCWHILFNALQQACFEILQQLAAAVAGVIADQHQLIARAVL